MTRRRWIALGASVATVALAIALILVFVVGGGDPPPAPLRLVGGLSDEITCSPYQATHGVLTATTGGEYVTNASSHPATLDAVRPILATNLSIVDLALVPITGNNVIGSGFGLPTEPHPLVAGALLGDWSHRELLPAVIPPKTSAPKVKYWQLVFGVRVPKPAESRLQGAIITYKASGHTYTLRSNIGQAYGPPGKATCPASETAT